MATNTNALNSNTPNSRKPTAYYLGPNLERRPLYRTDVGAWLRENPCCVLEDGGDVTEPDPRFKATVRYCPWFARYEVHYTDTNIVQAFGTIEKALHAANTYAVANNGSVDIHQRSLTWVIRSA